MDKKLLHSNILLFVTAAIWGLAFVGQRSSMKHIGPYFFNALRFALGATSLLPIYYFQQRKLKINTKDTYSGNNKRKSLFIGAAWAGIFLCLGASFQQVGIQYTTAGKAGFITGLYVIIVPIMGVFIGRRTRIQTWVGAVFALIGMYILSIKSGYGIALGDLLVFISAFFWAAHVQILGEITKKYDALAISIIQFYMCSLLSMLIALFVETIAITFILDAAVPILYTGLLSIGVAYTLQVVAQKHTHPSEAAIILSFESVFAVVGGMLILSEVLSLRDGIGCLLMLFGMIFSQLNLKRKCTH